MPEVVLLTVDGVRTRLPVEAELERSSGERDFSLDDKLLEDLWCTSAELDDFSFDKSSLLDLDDLSAP